MVAGAWRAVAPLAVQNVAGDDRPTVANKRAASTRGNVFEGNFNSQVIQRPTVAICL